MAFGSSPFGSSPFGATGGVTASFEYDLQPLGYVVNFGGPFVGRHDSLHAATSLGYIATFGGPYVAQANVYRMRSLGVVARFGSFTTPGDVAAAMKSLGLVPRFGNPSAIKFVNRAPS